MADVWRCERCKKVKELSGSHLDNKTSVRSDCWPCAKKTTFVRENFASASAAGSKSSNASAMPPSLAVKPANEAHAVAFQNIFAAAKAAAAAAAAQRTTSPSAFSFANSSREGSTEGSTASTTAAAAAAAPTAAGSVANANTGSDTTSFSAPRGSANPFLTPAVSAASIRRFQTSYANAMTTKHDDPAPAASTEHGKTTSSANTTPSTASPYVMEPAAGTSPPFTFRPNANYIPSTTSGATPWSTAVLGGMLPGTTAAMSAAAGAAAADASGGRTMSPAVAVAETTRAAAQSQSGVAGRAVLASASAASDSPLDVANTWMCEKCHKVKDLKGDHLRGKTTVRSDCWPCAKKRTFVLTTPRAVAAAGRPLKLGGDGQRSGSREGESASRAGSVAQQAGSAVFGKSSRAVSSSAAPPAFSNPFLVHSGGTHPPPQHLSTAAGAAADNGCNSASAPTKDRFSWVVPAIPAEATAEDPLLLHADARNVSLPATLAVGAAAATTTRTAAEESSISGSDPAALSSSWIVAAAGSTEADLATHYAALARFDQQLLTTFRERLVTGVQLRAVWYERVLYVIAEDAPPETIAAGAPVAAAGLAAQTSYDVVHAFAALGRYAALYLAIEQKLAMSRFRHVGRLFCPNEFALAAACCYANNFFNAERRTPAGAALTSPPSSQSTAAPAASACRFRVYGPQTDPTKALSLWGRIISGSPAAQLCVVSEEQRVVAAQTLYRRVSWLAAPQTMTGTAMQLSVEGEASADEHGVDVVLLTGTMRLEELPQAVPLAQLSQPYV